MALTMAMAAMTLAATGGSLSAPDFAGNRLQEAMFQEAMELFARGQAAVEEI